jgi:hypothetical protein
MEKEPYLCIYIYINLCCCCCCYVIREENIKKLLRFKWMAGGGGETAAEIERPEMGENRTFVLFQRDSAQEHRPYRICPSACPVADGGKRMESRLKATMKADDDNSPGPVSLSRLLFVRKDAGRRRRCCLISSLFSSSSSSQVKKEIDASDGLGQTSTVSVGWGGLRFTKHPFPPVFPTPRRTPSRSAGSLRVLKNRKKKKRDDTFFFTLERKTKKSLLHPTTESRTIHKLCGRKMLDDDRTGRPFRWMTNAPATTLTHSLNVITSRIIL